jgi:ferritin
MPRMNSRRLGDGVVWVMLFPAVAGHWPGPIPGRRFEIRQECRQARRLWLAQTCQTVHIFWPDPKKGKRIMLISQKVNKAINQQIGNEFGASLQYVSIASYLSEEGLIELSAFFYRQAEEERQHAMRFVKFVVDSGGRVEIPAIPAPRHSFKHVLEALQLSLSWEQEVTAQINALYALAVKASDYVTQNFLSWFIREQLEEVSTMDTLVKIGKRAKENLLFLEEFVARHGDKLRASGESED